MSETFVPPLPIAVPEEPAPAAPFGPILLVEDNPLIAHMVRAMLAEGGLPGADLVHVETIADALLALRRRMPCCVLLDLTLPDAEGMEGLLRLRAETAETAVVVLTATDDEGLALAAMQEGAEDYLLKGSVDADLLVRSIRHATERKRAENRRARHALHDGLTGVPNRELFLDRLNHALARARRTHLPPAVFFVDLDGFKAINDHLGHQAGDEALRRVARALEGELRTEDVLCRQGGDEFSVIAVAAGSGEANELARRLVNAVSRAGHGETPEPLSASAGWATFGEPERSAEGLLARADEALREAKRSGRAGVSVGPATAAAAAELRPPAPPMRAPERRRPTDRRLAALSEMARALALAADERAVVQIAVVHLAEALEASAVELWRRDEGSGAPVLVARGHHAGASPSDGQTVGDAELEAVMSDNHVAPLPGGGLVIPVSHDGRVHSVLAVVTERPDAGGLAQRRLALAMATQVGRALAAASARARLDQAGPEPIERFVSATGAGAEGARVAELAVAAGRELGLTPDELDTLRHAALLHKVGMLGVPAGLPLRPTPLSAEEVDVVREHPIIAQRLLGPIPRLGPAAVILRHANERHDGTGYPDGLAGDEIPAASRVLHAAIAYAAMREPRPWRAALSDDVARAELQRVAGTQLSPQAVEALLRSLDAAGLADRVPSR
jgi:two-component system, cell cycle response regulator